MLLGVPLNLEAAIPEPPAALSNSMGFTRQSLSVSMVSPDEMLVLGFKGLQIYTRVDKAQGL